MTQETPSNKYGTTPYSPTDAHSLGEEPRSVRLTKVLVWPLLVLHALSALFSIIAMQSMGPADYFRDYLPPQEFEQLSPDMLDTMFSAALISSIGFAAINVVLFVVVGLGLRANRNWARFLGLILAVLFLISALYSLVFATPYGDMSGVMFFETIISWVIVLVTIWWGVQALDKRTGQWFVMHRQLGR